MNGTEQERWEKEWWACTCVFVCSLVNLWTPAHVEKTQTHPCLFCVCWSSLEPSWFWKIWLPLCACISSVYMYMCMCVCVCMWWAAAEWGLLLKHHPVYSTHVTSVSHPASLEGQLWLVLKNKCCWNCEHIAVNTQHDVALQQSALCLRLVEINQTWNIVESK